MNDLAADRTLEYTLCGRIFEMYNQSFRLILADDRGVADDLSGDKLCDLSNELYDAGCDDGSPGVSCGILEVSFDREAENMMDAIRSAIQQVESVGCRVLKVVSPDQRSFDRMNEELANRTETAITTDG